MNQGIGEKEFGGGAPGSPGEASAHGRGQHLFWRIAGGVANLLNLGPDAPPSPGASSADVGTQLAHQRTDMALERNYMAAERTLMAWIRTALSMISFGFTIGKLGQALQSVALRGWLGGSREVSVQGIAYFLVILGTLALLLASFQHWVQVRELRERGLRRRVSVAYVVALLLAVVGGFALSALVANL